MADFEQRLKRERQYIKKVIVCGFWLKKKILLQCLVSQLLKQAAPELAHMGTADPGAQWGFLRQGTRVAERPARSQQLSQDVLTRPGCCQRNHGHLHTYTKQPGELEQPGSGAPVCMEGHRHSTSSKGQFNWWSSPFQKKLSYGVHLAENCSLHSPEWMWPPRQSSDKNMHPPRSQAAGGAMAFHW